MAKKTELVLEINGEEKTFVADKPKARVTHRIMKMYSLEEKGELDSLEMFDELIDIVANHIFAKEEEVTEDAILDGLDADAALETLNGIIMNIMGISEEDVAAANEGK